MCVITTLPRNTRSFAGLEVQNLECATSIGRRRCRLKTTRGLIFFHHSSFGLARNNPPTSNLINNSAGVSRAFWYVCLVEFSEAHSHGCSRAIHSMQSTLFSIVFPFTSPHTQQSHTTRATSSKASIERRSVKQQHYQH